MDIPGKQGKWKIILGKLYCAPPGNPFISEDEVNYCPVVTQSAFSISGKQKIDLSHDKIITGGSMR